MNADQFRDEPSIEWFESSYARLPASVTDPWFVGKEFTSDWVQWKIGLWSSLAARIRRKAPSILEIGSWEGRSAIAWLNLLPTSHITCIDYWGGTEKERFNRNTAALKHRITKIRSESGRALEALLAQRRQFDLIYVDGSHTLGGTLQDTVLSWPLLRYNGILLWDDYHWEPNLPASERPQEAIDWFVTAHAKDFEVVHRGYQVAGRRLTRGPIQDIGVLGQVLRRARKLLRSTQKRLAAS